jgi:hypothetical protein
VKIEITEIERWSPQPGDRLIVRARQPKITDQQAADIKRRVLAMLALPDDFPIMVTGSDVSVSVAAL